MKIMPIRHNELVAIDMLRAIALISVVLYHFSWFTHPLETTLLRRGYIGVDIFFLVSGFLAAMTTCQVSPGKTACLRYLMLRIVRIVPAYFIITLAYLAVFKLMNLTLPSMAVLMRSFLFLPTGGLPGPVYGFPVVEVGWTLNYEFFFIP